MSSKRGRKRNDNLPPNRARDVQRAFRARRAAHLQALEQRVSELEEENNYFRQVLHLPPSSRPPLGKGPTGKDKPKSFEAGGVAVPASLSSLSQAITLNSSRESSVDSPASTRTSSLSPSAMASSMSTRSMQVIEGNSWDQTLLVNDHSNVQNTSDSPYVQASTSAPVSTKPLPYSQYANNTMSSSSRNTMQNNVYIPTHTAYPTTPTDRSLGGGYSSPGFIMRNEIREDSRHQYSYAQASYQSHDNSIHNQSSPPPPTSSMPSLQSLIPRDPALQYPRRTLADNQGFSMGQGYPHLPNPATLQGSNRQSELPRLHDNNVHTNHPHRPQYTSDGRINSMP